MQSPRDIFRQFEGKSRTDRVLAENVPVKIDVNLIGVTLIKIVKLIRSRFPRHGFDPTG